MEMQLYLIELGLPGRPFAQVYRKQAICKYYVCGSPASYAEFLQDCRIRLFEVGYTNCG